MKIENPFLFLLLCFLLQIQCKTEKQDISIQNAGYEGVIDRLSDAIIYEIETKNLNAISIALVDGQKTVWHKGFGYEDKENKKSATGNTIYRIGSVSKLFTDIAIMQKVEKGELDLDSPIKSYLPEFTPANPFGKEITLRQLMSHRSGLLREPGIGNYFDDSGTSLKQTVESISKSTLIHEPESKTKYSNAGIAVVGYVLEYLSNTPYTKYMKEDILKPLGMSKSAFSFEELNDPGLAEATMWSYDDRNFEAPVFELGMAPAGSLYAPMTDLAKFIQMLFNNGMGEKERLLEKNTLDEMFTPQYSKGSSTGYGIGFRISDFKGHKMVGHGGAIYGYSTQLSAIPSLQIGVACASSVDVSNTVTRRIANFAIELMYAVKNEIALPDYMKTESLDNIAGDKLLGTYKSGDDIVQIEKRKNDFFLVSTEDVPLRNSTQGIITDSKIDFGTSIATSETGIQINGEDYNRIDPPKGSDYPEYWDEIIGEYGWDHNILFVYEDMGDLWLLMEWIEKDKLDEISKDQFAFPSSSGMYHGEKLRFNRDKQNRVISVSIENGPVFKRRDIGASTTETFRIQPVKPIDQLREIALSASPPEEKGEFRSSELIELKNLDPSIQYDIRYASTNNFMSNRFYTLPRAYMQQPAAKALVNVQQRLQKLSLGLLIHDAYRPWYVTKMFWDATPADKKIFVANPGNGSRHNRGCAVDLTLIDLKTGNPIQMVAGYDEMTDRSYPYYYGGNTRQRYYRKLLREMMEQEGFSIYDYEWWHFDYKDWRSYRIGNTRFEDL